MKRTVTTGVWNISAKIWLSSVLLLGACMEPQDTQMPTSEITKEEIQKRMQNAQGRTPEEAVAAAELGAFGDVGIWQDGEGCDHIIFDDGVEGYLAPLKDTNGKQFCD